MPPTLLMTSTAGVSWLDRELQRRSLGANGDVACATVDAQADRLDGFGRECDLNVHRFRDRSVLSTRCAGTGKRNSPVGRLHRNGAVTGALRPVGCRPPERLAGHIHAVNSNLVYLNAELPRVTAVGPKAAVSVRSQDELRREHDLPGGYPDVVAPGCRNGSSRLRNHPD